EYLWKSIDIFISMIGIRLNSGKILLLWVPLIAISAFISDLAVVNDLLVPYAIACWAFYYVGMTLVLGTGIKRWMISKFGEDRAWLGFQVILGLMFFNVGTGISAAALHQQGAFALPPLVMWALLVPMFIIGFVIKFWSTWVVGVDVYYYKDLFHEKSHKQWTEAGPYKWLSNPMYGIGYLHSYCLGIMLGSLWGLFYAAICHLSIFVFYQIAEKPFIVRTYLS
ncbi:MAG: methyltransferase, partial [Candidatus Thermoplasmatota archaeon]|nr:methyltransferase [Candidatus Thermoplasmatota archaeon]